MHDTISKIRKTKIVNATRTLAIYSILWSFRHILKQLVIAKKLNATKNEEVAGKL